MAVFRTKMSNLFKRSSHKTFWNITLEIKPHSPCFSMLLGSVAVTIVWPDSLNLLIQFWRYQMYISLPARNWSNGPDSQSHLNQLKVPPPSTVTSKIDLPNVVAESQSVLWDSVTTRDNGLLAKGHAQKCIHGWTTSKEKTHETETKRVFHPCVTLI